MDEFCVQRHFQQGDDTTECQENIFGLGKSPLRVRLNQKAQERIQVINALWGFVYPRVQILYLICGRKGFVLCIFTQCLLEAMEKHLVLGKDECQLDITCPLIH